MVLSGISFRLLFGMFGGCLGWLWFGRLAGDFGFIKVRLVC